MNLKESIIDLYLRLASAYKAIVGDKSVRERGFPPDLSDVKILTIECAKRDWAWKSEVKTL